MPGTRSGSNAVESGHVSVEDGGAGEMVLYCTELREVFPCLSIELMTRSLTYSADAVLS